LESIYISYPTMDTSWLSTHRGWPYYIIRINPVTVIMGYSFNWFLFCPTCDCRVASPSQLKLRGQYRNTCVVGSLLNNISGTPPNRKLLLPTPLPSDMLAFCFYILININGLFFYSSLSQLRTTIIGHGPHQSSLSLLFFFLSFLFY